ncbi:stage 0 sporulation protein [candidate division WOR-3 bacterium]|nr:stage 0 sporulation protein [candidate division WOR-3 bacterium]
MVETARPLVWRVQIHPFKTEPCELPTGVEVQPGDRVIVRDDEGDDLGTVLGPGDDAAGIGVVVRRATEADLAIRHELDEKTVRVLDLFRRQKDEFKLDMKVVDAHWRWDRKKVCFYFIAEHRLDFRGLHKVISSALNIRVAIKQIGVRDHARVLGGLGPCGRELCCATHLDELTPVALRMARLQNLFVEPGKISGVCGKLLCCLKFEEETYRRALAEMPAAGSTVKTARGAGHVTRVDVPTRKVTVRYEDGFEQTVGMEELGDGKGD